MPNHIKTIVRITGPNAKDVLPKLSKHHPESVDTLFGKEHRVPAWTNPFDFEMIIPMPDHIYRGNLGKAEEEKYGEANCWYRWSINNWGTKWNSYSHEKINDTTIAFQTAWSFPDPVMLKLSKMFPKNKFFVRYADEDMGSNCGSIIFKNGVLFDENYFEYSAKSRAFAHRIWNKKGEPYEKD